MMAEKFYYLWVSLPSFALAALLLMYACFELGMAEAKRMAYQQRPTFALYEDAIIPGAIGAAMLAFATFHLMEVL